MHRIRSNFVLQEWISIWWQANPSHNDFQPETDGLTSVGQATSGLCSTGWGPQVLDGERRKWRRLQTRKNDLNKIYFVYLKSNSALKSNKSHNLLKSVSPCWVRMCTLFANKVQDGPSGLKKVGTSRSSTAKQNAFTNHNESPAGALLPLLQSLGLRVEACKQGSNSSRAK